MPVDTVGSEGEGSAVDSEAPPLSVSSEAGPGRVHATHVYMEDAAYLQKPAGLPMTVQAPRALLCLHFSFSHRQQDWPVQLAGWNFMHHDRAPLCGCCSTWVPNCLWSHCTWRPHPRIPGSLR